MLQPCWGDYPHVESYSFEFYIRHHPPGHEKRSDTSNVMIVGRVVCVVTRESVHIRLVTTSGNDPNIYKVWIITGLNRFNGRFYSLLEAQQACNEHYRIYRPGVALPYPDVGIEHET